MDHFKVSFFSLSPKEKRECKTLKIPNYYLLYSRIAEHGHGIEQLKEFIKQGISPVFSKQELTGHDFKQLKEFIKQRILKQRILPVSFSRQELTKLVEGIVNKIKELVRLYGDGDGQKIEKLEKEFNFKIFSLAKEIVAGRKTEIKVKEKSKTKKMTLSFVSRSDGQKLNPVLVLRGKTKEDEYCVYFEECNIQAINYGRGLDCSTCEHQNI